jgi:hypothetical protein
MYKIHNFHATIILSLKHGYTPNFFIYFIYDNLYFLT